MTPIQIRLVVDPRLLPRTRAFAREFSRASFQARQVTANRFADEVQRRIRSGKVVPPLQDLADFTKRARVARGNRPLPPWRETGSLMAAMVVERTGLKTYSVGFLPRPSSHTRIHGGRPITMDKLAHLLEFGDKVKVRITGKSIAYLRSLMGAKASQRRDVSAERRQRSTRGDEPWSRDITVTIPARPAFQNTAKEALRSGALGRWYEAALFAALSPPARALFGVPLVTGEVVT